MISIGFILGLVTHLVIAAPFQDDRKVCRTSDCKLAARYLLSGMDTDVNPCDDFYKFACGGYEKNTEIPNGFDRWNQFYTMETELYDRLQVIISDYSKNQNTYYSSLVNNLFRDCYYSYHNTELAIDSIRNLFKEFGGWVVLEDADWSKIDWKEISYKLRSKGISVRVFLPIDVVYNYYNASKYTVEIGVSDFILPQTDLTQGFSNPNVLKYRQRIMTLIEKMGVSMSEYTEKEVDNILELEIELAKIPQLYNRQNMTLEQLQRDYSAIPWKIYLENMIASPGIELDDKFIIYVTSVDYLKQINEFFRNVSPKILASYIQFRAAVAILHTVGMDFTSGNLESNPYNVLKQRQLVCIDIVKEALPTALSALYVRKYLTPAIKGDVEDMLKEFKLAFIQLLKENKWLDEPTKAAAIKKVVNMVESVGYPKQLLNDKFLDDFYSPVNYSDNYIDFYFNIRKFQTDFRNSKLDEVRKRMDWEKHSAVTTVNAVYFVLDNSIDIMAAFIRDPIYRQNRPNYINYASIGSVIGHEINHGFDGTGAAVDEYGQIKFWFTNNSLIDITKRAICLFEQYTAQSNNSVTAHLTNNEDIADSGGIIAAYKAYENWVHHNKKESGLPGLNYTVKQLFWISYGRLWCAKETDKYITEISPHETHSRNSFRVRVPLMNSPEFSSDFNCPVGSYMNPINKCELWL